LSISVGIDLGTTFSAVAYIDPHTKLPKLIPNCEGEKITPSVIQFIDGLPVFGSEAVSAFDAGEPGCVATFKRGMGKSEAYCVIDDNSYTAEELSSLLLRHLKEDAEANLGDTIKDAVITVPAYFYSTEREATIRAATSAGIKVKKIIDEPNAAAMAYGLNNWRENANILVYDLGGGTFDVTLTRMGQNGNLTTITTHGDHFLGGRDWDDRIELLLIDKFAEETGLDISSDSSIKTMLRGMAEGIKKQLSAMQSTKVIASIPDFGSATVTISRGEFEENSEDLIDRTGSLCQAVLAEAGLSTRDVTDVLLVGGSTRMPQVSQYILSIFGKKPIAHINPDEAVALGAAIQSVKENASYAALSIQVTEDGKKVTDRREAGLSSHLTVRPSQRLSSLTLLTLQETTAHAMGIIAVNYEGNRYYNEIIIPANHPRPVRVAKRFRFYTSSNSLNELEIYVLQGDHENPLDCLIPYKYVVSGISHVRRGEVVGTIVRVQYSYDDNGIIHIQARQGVEVVDLPIRKENVPTDMTKYGKPIGNDSTDSHYFLGLQLGQNVHQDVVHKYKTVTFSNVKWERYDNILYHESGAAYNEPPVHVFASEKAIEFHGYNVSAMDEGVYYTVSMEDDFDIECDIDTSYISPHPGGNLTITLGIITATLNENGGNMILDETVVATVGAKFKLRMSVTNGGLYEIYIDGKLVGSKAKPSKDNIEVRFGFVHGSHCCSQLSHAYITDIDMLQSENQSFDTESSETDTWDD